MLNAYVVKLRHRSDSVPFCSNVAYTVMIISAFILLHEQFLQFDWLRAVVFQLNLKYLHVKITKPLRVVVYTNIIIICT